MNSSSGTIFLGFKSYIALKVKALLIGKKLLSLDLCREKFAKFTVSDTFQESYQMSRLYLSTPQKRTNHPLGSSLLCHSTKHRTKHWLCMKLGKHGEMGCGGGHNYCFVLFNGNFASGNKKTNLNLRNHLGFYNVSQAAKTHLPLASSTDGAISTERPNSRSLRSWGLPSPAGSSRFHYKKKTWYFISHAHWPVTNGNNPRLGQTQVQCHRCGKGAEMELTLPRAVFVHPAKRPGFIQSQQTAHLLAGGRWMCWLIHLVSPFFSFWAW